LYEVTVGRKKKENNDNLKKKKKEKRHRCHVSAHDLPIFPFLPPSQVVREEKERGKEKKKKTLLRGKKKKKVVQCDDGYSSNGWNLCKSCAMPGPKDK